MKNILYFLAGCLLFSGVSNAQELKDLDYVSPFHEDLAAVKKGSQWGFINKEGTLVLEYRDDLVIPKESSIECCEDAEPIAYPFFKNGRCLVKKMKDGIVHFGYIDTKGNTVIEPKFVNATHFHGNYAIVLNVYKENLGRNEILGKNMITYSYNEEVIDTSGKMIIHLRGPVNLLYTKEKLKTPPKIKSKFIGKNAVAVRTDKGKWSVEIFQ